MGYIVDINKFEKLGLGQYVGGHCDRWEWTHIEEDWAKFTIKITEETHAKRTETHSCVFLMSKRKG